MKRQYNYPKEETIQYLNTDSYKSIKIPSLKSFYQTSLESPRSITETRNDLINLKSKIKYFRNHLRFNQYNTIDYTHNINLNVKIESCRDSNFFNRQDKLNLHFEKTKVKYKKFLNKNNDEIDTIKYLNTDSSVNTDFRKQSVNQFMISPLKTNESNESISDMSDLIDDILYIRDRTNDDKNVSELSMKVIEDTQNCFNNNFIKIGVIDKVKEGYNFNSRNKNIDPMIISHKNFSIQTPIKELSFRENNLINNSDEKKDFIKRDNNVDDNQSPNEIKSYGFSPSIGMVDVKDTLSITEYDVRDEEDFNKSEDTIYNNTIIDKEIEVKDVSEISTPINIETYINNKNAEDMTTPEKINKTSNIKNISDEENEEEDNDDSFIINEIIRNSHIKFNSSARDQEKSESITERKLTPESVIIDSKLSQDGINPEIKVSEIAISNSNCTEIENINTERLISYDDNKKNSCLIEITEESLPDDIEPISKVTFSENITYIGYLENFNIKNLVIIDEHGSILKEESNNRTRHKPMNYKDYTPKPIIKKIEKIREIKVNLSNSKHIINIIQTVERNKKFIHELESNRKKKLRNPTPRKIKKIDFDKQFKSNSLKNFPKQPSLNNYSNENEFVSEFSASDEERKIKKKSNHIKKEEYGKFKDIIGRLNIKSGKKEKNKSDVIYSNEKLSSQKNLSF